MNDTNKLTMIKELESNFNSVQDKINEIIKQKNIDIKQISDLQRYIEMQSNIIESIYLLEDGEK